MTAKATPVTSDHQWIAVGRTGTAAVLKRTCFSVMSTATGDTAAGAGFTANSSCGLLMGAVRFKIYDSDYQASLTALRNALDDNDFEAAWTEGAGLSTEEAIAYAQRGRGERKRPATGWASLTPA